MRNRVTNIGDVNFKFTTFIIFLLVAFDILSAYLGLRLSIAPRLLLIFSCLVGLLATGVKVNDLNIICYLLAAVIFQQCVSYIILPNISVLSIAENIGLMVKVLSFPLLLLWFEKLDIKQLASQKKILYFSIIVYCISIVVSPLLGADSLLTYGDTGRFGYKGIINAGNETAMVLLIACFLTGQRYLENKSFFSLVLFFIMILSALMLGTKAGILIALTSMFGVFVINFKKIKSHHKVVLVTLTSVAMFYFVNWFGDVLYPVLEASSQYFASKLTDTTAYGYFSLLVSGRDTKLIVLFNQLGVANYYHLLMGGWPVSIFMVEMDYFDVILLFGIPLGTAIFYFYFFLIYRRLTKSAMHILFFIVMFIITFLAGHIMLSMLHAPLLAAYVVLSSQEEKR